MNRKERLHANALMASLVGLAAFATAARAETITWLGITNSSWGTATNWAPPRVPGSGDVAVFPDGADRVNINLNGHRVVNSVHFDSNAARNYTINGNNTLTLESGGLQVEAGGVVHTINCPIIVPASSPWTVSGTSQLVVNGVISESGATLGLDKQGDGRLILNAENALSGLVKVSAGSLELGTNNALQHNTIELAVSGELSFSETAPNGVIGNLSGSGNYNTSSTELTLGGNNEDETYAGVLSGSQNITKVGTGTWVLTGDSSGYFRRIRVTEGTLQLDGQHARRFRDDIYVDPDGTITGVGTAANILADGVVAPGNPLGTLNALWDISVADATLHIELGGTTQGVDYDSLYAVEELRFSRSTLVVSYANGFTAAPGDEFVIAEAGVRILSFFENITFPDDQGWYTIFDSAQNRIILRVCNELGIDCNNNGIPDLCELDDDGDGVPNDCDTCPGADDTLDDDGDGVPNDCDSCQGDDASGDSDNDGVCDSNDVCPGSDDNGPDGDDDGIPDTCDVCDGNDTGDIDGDGDIDFDDLAGFDICLTGPGVPVDNACNCFDVDADGAVTLADYAIIQASALGSGIVVEGPGEISIENIVNGISDKGFAIFGEAADDLAGYSVAIIGDLNDDGLSEMLIGAPSWGTGDRRRAGRAYVVYGRTDLQSIALADVAAGIGGFALEGEFGRIDHEYPITEIGEQFAWDEGPDGEGAGFCVDSAGDVNGDGVSDLLISAPYAPVNDGELWGGRTYVVFGSASLASPLPLNLGGITAPGAGGGFRIDAHRGQCEDDCADTNGRSSSGDLAGWMVGGARDINGDGLADVVIGAPNWRNDDRGRAYAVFGAADTATVSLGNLLEGDSPRGFPIINTVQPTGSDRYGHRVSALGDFTGDGLSDVLVTPQSALELATYLVHGTAATAEVEMTRTTPNVTRLITGFVEQGQQTFILGRLRGGLPTKCAGDFNGDGRVDWVVTVATILENPDPFGVHEIYVIFGSDDEDGGTIDLDERFGRYNDPLPVPDRGVKLTLSSFGFAGEWRWEISPVGDVNGDGLDDIAIGVQNRTAVVFGRRESGYVDLGTALDGQQGLIISGAEAGDQHGYSVSAAGDVNGDGINDLLMGSPQDDTIDIHAGSAYLIYGADFNGAITHFGTESHDVIDGTTGADSIVAGRGSDIVNSNGGADTVYLGAGDDTVVLADTDFHRLRGGPGLDSIRISGGMTLDLEAQRGRIEGFEQVVLNRPGADVLSVRTIDVLNMSPTGNDLTVIGDAEDQLVAIGDLWVRDTGVATGGGTFIRFTDGRAELLVDSRMALRFSPTIMTTAFAIAENSPLGTSLGTIEAIDPAGDTVASYAIVGGDGQGTFAIDADTGEVTVDGALDFETQSRYTLEITATDETGDSGTREIVIDIICVNEAPIWTVQDFVSTLAEHAPVGMSVGSFTAVDPDEGDGVRYLIDVEDASLTSPALTGAFAIDSTTGALTVADGSLLDRETSATQELLVYAEDMESVRSVPVLVSINLSDVQTWEIPLSTAFVTNGASMWDTEGAVGASTLMFQKRIDGSTRNPRTGSLIGIDLSIDIEGVFEYSSAITTGHGSVDANIPFEVVLTVDDEIALGQPFTIELDRPAPGTPTLSGMTPNVDMDLLIELDQFEVLTNFNNFGPYTGSNSGDDHLESSVPQPWEATAQPDGSLITGPFSTELISLNAIDWDSYLLNFLEIVNIPTNEGDFTINNVPGVSIWVQYILWTLEMAGSLRIDQELSLEVDGYDALIVFENGQSQPLNMDALTQITLPLNADTNDDGRVDFEVRIDIDTTFSNRSDYIGTITPMLTIGYMAVTAFPDCIGCPPDDIELGPIVDFEVNLDVGDDDIGAPTPWPTGEVGQFPLGGFNTVVLTGAIDLMN